MKYNLGDTVEYEDELYTIFWIYDSEYVELGSEDKKCVLAKAEDIRLIKAK
ncbi:MULTISPECIES: hypothetical protein [unclassified Rossellomorea]|uniref:hypothetical protein n=1 Tax=unclassified Rossellomorea TaxID=2837526 RepID=UPI0020C72830|nr:MULTISPECIES: hypothetical protein [unclassified Rossellomorea]UTE76843.1 hypothetical protein M1J35_20190 [Rossellomorea sp. KS-H15a]WGG44759.1 hypothetical protein P8596_18595 [Rossellomorea sp. DA94]